MRLVYARDNDLTYKVQALVSGMFTGILYGEKR